MKKVTYAIPSEDLADMTDEEVLSTHLFNVCGVVLNLDTDAEDIDRMIDVFSHGIAEICRRLGADWKVVKRSTLEKFRASEATSERPS